MGRNFFAWILAAPVSRTQLVNTLYCSRPAFVFLLQLRSYREVFNMDGRPLPPASTTKHRQCGL